MGEETNETFWMHDMSLSGVTIQSVIKDIYSITIC